MSDIQRDLVIVRADSHAYPHASSAQRAAECLEAFEWTYKMAAEHGAKWVFDAGDVFHERAYIDTYMHAEIYRIAKKWHRQGIQTLWDLGNHDMYFKNSRDHSSIAS